MWKMGEYIENELQMFEEPAEIAEIGKLIVISRQVRQRKMIVTMSLCKQRKQEAIFQDRCIFVMCKIIIIILKLQGQNQRKVLATLSLVTSPPPDMV